MNKYLAIATLSLAACATAPSPAILLAEDVHVITAEQLDQYWVDNLDEKTFRSRLNTPQKTGRVPITTPCGYVVAEYLIDSNGRLFNVEIEESKPKGFYDQAAIRALSLSEFHPAESNPGRVPVKVTQRITFRDGGQDCPDAPG